MTGKCCEDAILNDQSATYWLKQQLSESKNRDVLDALKDAETLVAVLAERARDLGVDLPAAHDNTAVDLHWYAPDIYNKATNTFIHYPFEESDEITLFDDNSLDGIFKIKAESDGNIKLLNRPSEDLESLSCTPDDAISIFTQAIRWIDSKRS